MNTELLIENRGIVYQPAVEDGITWETERQGYPGKLTFKVLRDETLNFQEGNSVRFKVNGQNVFFGYVFSKKRDKDQSISVVAYDQLRYFKNKDIYVYANKKASDLVKMIAADFNLKTGDIADTRYAIQQRVEDNKTLFDIIYNALDLTLTNTKKMYVLYDDFGKLILKDIEQLRLDLVVGKDTAANFNYETSIDSDTYNRIKLAYDNEETGKRDIYMVQDSSNMNAWGVLQYFEKLNERTNGKAKADALLSLYNRKSRSLEIQNALGDIRARAGTSVVVYLPEIGDISIQNYMLVERAKHTFRNNEHLMNLTVRGGGW